VAYKRRRLIMCKCWARGPKAVRVLSKWIRCCLVMTGVCKLRPAGRMRPAIRVSLARAVWLGQ
jgi:hypothetical protein